MLYLTKDDYMNIRGIDLSLELRGSATDNESNAVNIFLENLQQDLLEYMQLHFDVDIDNLDPVVMKRVMAHQVDFIRRNGDLSLDYENHTEFVIAPKAFVLLKSQGYANLHTGRSYYYGNRFKH